MNETVKSTLYRMAPSLYGRLLNLRYQRETDSSLELPESKIILKKVIERHGLKVQRGPFAGMNYVPEAVGSPCKLVGSYEIELISVLNLVLSDAYDTVVDVGCAEGYYAVGMAMRMPQVTVKAFDTNPSCQYRCKKMAQANGVEKRVQIGGTCSPATLQQALQGKSFLLCDCEGYELELLTLTAVPALRNTTMLIELHDCFFPGLTNQILDRFQDSHVIQIITAQERDAAAYPTLQFLTPTQQQAAIDEQRMGTQQWAYMTPKQ